jgi:electron transport complex protein RnfB
MHTIIIDACTGCDLCIPACPVDCIITIEAPLPKFIQRIEKPALYEIIEEAKQW